MKFSTRDLCFCAIGAALIAVCAVSYTHLTLPTKLEV